MEKQRVIIDVEHWGTNALLNDQGMKCCLGFICEQVFGSTPGELQGKGYYPDRLEDTVPEWYEDVNKTAARINDNSSRTRDWKIQELRRLFNDDPENPVELVFTEGGVELP